MAVEIPRGTDNNQISRQEVLSENYHTEIMKILDPKNISRVSSWISMNLFLF